MINSSTLWLAITIYHEAEGESMDGKIAVAHVILNRAEKRRKTVREVVLEPYQFSCYNNSKRPPIDDYLAFFDSVDAAYRCKAQRMTGKKLDGADHYFADWIDQPKWAAKMTKITRIGQHTFYRA